jgi:glucosamine-6-phosphate deaminase
MLISKPLMNMPEVEVFPYRKAMGAAAAKRVQDYVTQQVSQHGHCRMIVGCAPSQDDLFAALVREAQKTSAVWSQVELFHMDDYIGLTESHPQSFRYYLRKHFLDHVAVGSVHLLRGEAPDPDAEARRYAALLQAAPIDLICLGFGENGHLAFNDPPVADFNDPMAVKVVVMDSICRQQQVNDGCFPSIDAVPERALTITLPVFSSARMLCGVVPTHRKAPAVKAALTGPIGEACPASLLRVHAQAYLFLDAAAGSLIPADYPLTTRGT